MGHYLQLNLEVKLDCFKAQLLFILIAFKKNNKKGTKYNGTHGCKYIIKKKEHNKYFFKKEKTKRKQSIMYHYNSKQLYN